MPFFYKLPDLAITAHTADTAVIGIDDNDDGTSDVYVSFSNESWNDRSIYRHDPFFGDAVWTVQKLTELLTQLERAQPLTIIYSSTVDFRPGDIELPIWT